MQYNERCTPLHFLLQSNNNAGATSLQPKERACDTERKRCCLQTIDFGKLTVV